MIEFERFLRNIEVLLGAGEGPGNDNEAIARSRRAEAPGEVVAAAGRDAIARELTAHRRTTQVRSLREAPEVEAFRNELIDGLIRVDTANQLLKLVNDVLFRLPV